MHRIRLDPQSWEGRGAGRKESAKKAMAGRGQDDGEGRRIQKRKKKRTQQMKKKSRGKRK